MEAQIEFQRQHNLSRLHSADMVIKKTITNRILLSALIADVTSDSSTKRHLALV